ncbi:hypothetical protein RZ532_17705 [Nitratireductor aquimarinus]|uniref:hypothetical protein n=1 Tax=Nitratireductor aquimarinus TaxID=889300 RepID=UPI00293656A8|nr:hypothetical protein [Nitratireductor aquimarinus]MDV2967831.1 hypothetical protein [Nitratireductor aquimarinus]
MMSSSSGGREDERQADAVGEGQRHHGRTLNAGARQRGQYATPHSPAGGNGALPCVFLIRVFNYFVVRGDLPATLWSVAYISLMRRGDPMTVEFVACRRCGFEATCVDTGKREYVDQDVLEKMRLCEFAAEHGGDPLNCPHFAEAVEESG